ncbi:hypothetical protein SASPL_135137 [Salvia splendens]|uniref:Uncharacterized protein n=1 Tax=Salvia splendens TaxID=180675 RepID=A0A8X8WXB4_SALSN|nr:hypothetical protein SASPL_135137 [Salvia splendens]
MDSPYSYSDEQQRGYYEECYSPDQEGSYYNPDYFDFSYIAQDYYVNENSETCARMEEQPRSKWSSTHWDYIPASTSSGFRQGRKEREKEQLTPRQPLIKPSGLLQISTAVRQGLHSQQARFGYRCRAVARGGCTTSQRSATQESVPRSTVSQHCHHPILPERNPQKGNAFLPFPTLEEEEERKKALEKPRGPPKVELKPLPGHLSKLI